MPIYECMRMLRISHTTHMERNTHTIDATDRILGRLATEIAILLRGKNKASFDPAIDGGDRVEVKNVAGIKVTGAKMKQKIYYHHTGYPGGLKEETLEKLWDRLGPDEVLRRAVWNMLPKNNSRKAMIKRLVFKK